MASTLANLCNQLKQKPTQISNFSKIVQLLMSKKIPVSQKLANNQSICDIIKGYLTKIDKKSQEKTYQYIQKVVQNYTQIILSLAKEDPIQAFSAFALFVTSLPSKTDCIKVVASKIFEGQTKGIDWCLLNQCSILKLILIQLYQRLKDDKKQNDDNHCQNIVNFLFQIDHMNSLVPDDTVTVHNQNEDVNRQFKACFQKIFIQCLSQMQKQDELSIKIYHKLGDKVFSKLQTPLLLSDFLLNKFNAEENPAIQIQVLSCLFIVVGKYGLEMDKFYESLQKMIGSKRGVFNSLFRLKNSKRFLKLVETSMRSSRVPFKTILNLTKLIIRQTFKQQSQFSFWALSFLVNLVKKHRQLEKHLTEIPELECLKNHYSPRIRSLIGELSKNLNKSEYLDIEQFGKVNCERLSAQKLVEIGQKMQANDEQIQFKIGKTYNFL